MLNRFSSQLCELYRLAEAPSPRQCAAQVVQFLRCAAYADGAVAGEGAAHHDGRLPAERIAADPHPLAFARDYAMLAAADPLVHDLAALPMQTRFGSCAELYAPAGCASLRRLMHAAGVGHLMLVATASVARLPQSWCMLLRTPDSPFYREDAHYLTAIWPHVLRTFELNRRCVLEARVAEASGEGHALLGADYALANWDAAFAQLFALEWPGRPAPELPDLVRRCLAESGRYAGKRVSLTVSGAGDRMLCLITAPDGLALLTPTERDVAEQYARGCSSKEIARSMYVSDNTVRTHLAHIFDKLGVHRKAELILRLAAK
jgi:DNA-binding CsgD family transcriptional regulator